jgi:hypothetical protein
MPSTRQAGVPHAFDDPWIDFRSGRMASASENCVTHFADAFRFLLERTIALAAGRRCFGARTPGTIRILVLALCLLASAGAADAALAQLEFRAGALGLAPERRGPAGAFGVAPQARTAAAVTHRWLGSDPGV